MMVRAPQELNRSYVSLFASSDPKSQIRTFLPLGEGALGINKKDSRLDREQKSKGEYYYG